MADFDSLEKKIEELAQITANGFAAVHKEMDERFSKADERYEQIDRRFIKVEERFDTIDQKLERIERTLDTQIQSHLGLEARVTKLEQPAA
jgi:hypothetical protein